MMACKPVTLHRLVRQSLPLQLELAAAGKPACTYEYMDSLPAHRQLRHDACQVLRGRGQLPVALVRLAPRLRHLLGRRLLLALRKAHAGATVG